MAKYNTVNAETAQFITTWRGFPMLVVGSYRYGLKTKYKEQQKKRWICVSWSRGCRAAVTTQDTTILAFKNQHNHYPGPPHCTAVFTTSSRGNPMIQVGSYNFALHSDCKRSVGPKKRWVCSMTASRHRCRASVTTVDDVVVYLEGLPVPEFTTSSKGYPLIRIGKYSFGEHSDNKRTKGPKRRWVCTTTRCRAFLITIGDEIIRCHIYNVSVRKAFAGDRFSSVQLEQQEQRHEEELVLFPRPIFTTSRYGKPVILIGPYRFNKYCRSKGPKAIWICVKSCNGCRATLTTLNDEIVKLNNNHNH
ncbi:FLYWCH zinc finger domain-containing protein [Phthorimaea operculella]|nr:FLYWCH zinc finger domain-containing protein [Phthorimaea operculella]